jgi:arylsulfatase A-like enzyme
MVDDSNPPSVGHVHHPASSVVVCQFVRLLLVKREKWLIIIESHSFNPIHLYCWSGTKNPLLLDDERHWVNIERATDLLVLPGRKETMTNIALVVLDTLRRDAFDRHFDWLPGRRFEQAYTMANWTVPAHASLFTGRYASEVGVHAKHMYLDCTDSVLAEQLRAAGYTTRAFSANTNVTGHFDFDRGFEDFRVPKSVEFLANDDLFDWREFSRGTSATGLRKYLSGVRNCLESDSATLPSLVAGVRAVISDSESFGVKYGGLIEAQKQLATIDIGNSEFLFLNLMETHEPYRVPDEYRTVEEPDLLNSIGDIALGDVDAEQARQAYNDCARYLSDEYRNLFETLTEDFDYVITLSDHGEMLGEGDAWGHEYGVHPALMHVPLTIYGDGLDGVCEEAVSLLNVYATVLDMADIERDSLVRGQTLLGDCEGREYLTEYRGLTSWSEEKLVDNGHTDLLERYDRPLRGYVSPEGDYGYETSDDFVTTGMDKVDNPEQRLQQLVDDLDIREVETDNEVPAEIKEQLESLGYA